MTPEQSLGPKESPINQLAKLFIDTSVNLPQNLVGVGSVMNLRAIQLLDEGSMSWDDFINSQLEGDNLDKAVTTTIEKHKKVGGGSIDSEKLGEILPHVYVLTVSNLITSVAELAKGDAGEMLEGPTKADSDAADTARGYLFEGHNARAHRTQVIELLQANFRVLTSSEEPANAIPGHYREALLGNSSDLFRDADQMSTSDKKRILADIYRPILNEKTMPLGAKYGLSERQVTTFVHNITRP